MKIRLSTEKTGEVSFTYDVTHSVDADKPTCVVVSSIYEIMYTKK